MRIECSEWQVEREDGHVYLHGPTSAFRHLGKYPRGLAGGLNIYPAPTSRGPLPFGHMHMRYLPPSVHLSQEDHDRCLDRFFGYYACWGGSARSDHAIDLADDRYEIERLAVQTRHGPLVDCPLSKNPPLLSYAT
jgi:hypothetical protein